MNPELPRDGLQIKLPIIALIARLLFSKSMYMVLKIKIFQLGNPHSTNIPLKKV